MLQEGVPAFSVDQPEEGMTTLEQRALERQVRNTAIQKNEY
jgi:hypothetical protein